MKGKLAEKLCATITSPPLACPTLQTIGKHFCVEPIEEKREMMFNAVLRIFMESDSQTKINRLKCHLKIFNDCPKFVGFFLFYNCCREFDDTQHLQFVVDEEVVDELVLLGRSLGLDHDGESSSIVLERRG